MLEEQNVRDLSLAALKNAYADGLSVRELILTLREQALDQTGFNAWINVLDESQLDSYVSALQLKNPEDLPLYGVPFAIKDNIDLSGIPTTAGCPDFSYTPQTSAPVVQALIAAGAIPLGKTNLDQFATGLVGTRSPFGEGKNTFNSDYISGGSSAGSAIATALGQVSFALGTDTAGSGRVPAVLNNLIGFKPTRGLLSTRGVVPACRTLDCVSIFTLNTVDAAQILDVAAVADEDAYSRENHYSNCSRYYNGQAVNFSFGVPENLNFQGDDQIRSLFESSIALLESQGGHAVAISFEPFLEAAKLLYEGPWVAERWLATQGVKAESMLPVIQEIIKNANKGTAAEAFAAQYRLAALKKQCDALMGELDFLLAPTTPTIFTRAQIAENPLANNSILGMYTNFMNLLDYCAVAVPVGFTSSNVPWGATLFSYAFKDVAVLSFAGRLQQAARLPMGKTGLAYVQQDNALKTEGPGQYIDLVVCGAHLEGQPLNWQLRERGGKLKAKTHSASCYDLYALADGKRPAMVRNEKGGNAIEVEVWTLPHESLGSFVTAIPAPLGIGKVEMANGEWISGFICDGFGLTGAQNISEFGGWRAWLARS